MKAFMERNTRKDTVERRGIPFNRRCGLGRVVMIPLALVPFAGQLMSGGANAETVPVALERR